MIFGIFLILFCFLTKYRCETDIDYCKVYSEENNGKPPCLNNGTCTDLQLGFNCTCPTVNITGDRCQYSPESTCDTLEICQNGSTCTATPDEFFKWKCHCARGFKGRQCHQQIDYCFAANNPCQPNGRCENDRISYNYTCICDPGFTSVHCDENIDECSSKPCGKNGECIDLINTFKCNCSKGWKGITCNEDLNECAQYPCENNGTCINTPGSYSCDCLPPFEGFNCSDDVDECKKGICQNSILCENTYGSYKCTCAEGWTGATCHEDINDCGSSPCKNNGKCKDGNNTYSCECDGTGYEGKDCTQDINECINQTACFNGGTCRNRNGDYVCDCPSNYLGDKCDILNLCADEDCSGNGNCSLIGGETDCKCYEGILKFSHGMYFYKHV